MKTEKSTAYMLGSQALVSQTADIVRITNKVKAMKDTDELKDVKKILLTNLKYLSTIFNRFADINSSLVRNMINERLKFIAKECNFETKTIMK